MRDLERFINDDATFDAYPLINMALVHHHVRPWLVTVDVREPYIQQRRADVRVLELD
ncbi:MAG: hypothetical protein ABI212_04440 [Burkholderiaceae bacterium]